MDFSDVPKFYITEEDINSMSNIEYNQLLYQLRRRLKGSYEFKCYTEYLLRSAGNNIMPQFMPFSLIDVFSLVIKDNLLNKNTITHYGVIDQVLILIYKGVIPFHYLDQNVINGISSGNIEDTYIYSKEEWKKFKPFIDKYSKYFSLSQLESLNAYTTRSKFIDEKNNEVLYVHDKLKGSEYNFLRDDINLKDNIIYLALGGSRAKGNSNPLSDIDIRGIAFERKEVLLGCQGFQGYSNEDTDTHIFGFKKAIEMLTKGNPFMVVMFGTLNDHILQATVAGIELKSNINLFLSKKIYKSFKYVADKELKELTGLKSSSEDAAHDPHIYKLYADVISLILIATDILKGNGLNVYRPEPLTDIRNGRYSFTELESKIKLEYFPNLEIALSESKLPDEPDGDLIEKFQMDMYKKYVL